MIASHKVERKDALVFMGSEIVGIVEMVMGMEIVVSMRNDFPHAK